MNFSNKNLRNVLRVLHLVVGGLVIAYLYSPLGNVEWFGDLVRISVIPVLVMSGVSMWQMPLLTKFFKRQPPARQA